MHGMSRNADGYRDAWSGPAEKYGLVVLAPRMTKERFPGYIVGNMCKMNGEKVPQKDWYFNLIEELFDKVRRENNFGAKGYYLYGHSAGAQFVHRYMLFMPAPRMIMALPANAGWYTMPDFKVKFPYGLAGSGLTRDKLDQALGRKVCLLLGDRDNNPRGKYLNKKPRAEAQGPHRFARGHAFYAMGKSMAENDKVPFGWSVSIVKGVGHNNRRIAPQAAGIIHEDMIKGGE